MPSDGHWDCPAQTSPLTGFQRGTEPGDNTETDKKDVLVYVDAIPEDGDLKKSPGQRSESAVGRAYFSSFHIPIFVIFLHFA